MGVEIKVEHLSKSFGKQLIWGDVTLTVPAGEICVMLGPSGTGKSVLLKTLIGLLKPDRGSVVIEGTDIASCSERELYEDYEAATPGKKCRNWHEVVSELGALFDGNDAYAGARRAANAKYNDHLDTNNCARVVAEAKKLLAPAARP